jgi:hypothetical protein
LSTFLLKNLRVLSFNGCKRIVVNLTDQVLPSFAEDTNFRRTGFTRLQSRRRSSS